MRNGRRHADEFALERNGFRFVDHDTRVADFYDEDEIRRVYYPEMEALVKAEAGARRVVVFDHTLRTADDELRQATKIREVVRRVHNDYTEWSGPQRVRDLMGGEAEELLRHRFAVIQTWRPIRHPVESWPLAIADAKSLSPDDMVVTERRYPDRIGQTSAITWNPDHRWYWFPHMRPDEALVFKTFELMTDGRARFTAHTAFEDPTTPAPCAAARKHRDPHPGVFLSLVVDSDFVGHFSSSFPRKREPRATASSPALGPRFRGDDGLNKLNKEREAFHGARAPDRHPQRRVLPPRL